MIKAVISPEGLVAIPDLAREKLKLLPGTEISMDIHGDLLIVKRMDHNYPDWRTMRGMAKEGESLTKGLMEERAAEKAHDDARTEGR